MGRIGRRPLLAAATTALAVAVAAALASLPGGGRPRRPALDPTLEALIAAGTPVVVDLERHRLVQTVEAGRGGPERDEADTRMVRPAGE